MYLVCNADTIYKNLSEVSYKLCIYESNIMECYLIESKDAVEFLEAVLVTVQWLPWDKELAVTDWD